MRFVGGQRDFWRGTFGAAGGGLTTPTPTVMIMANRTSGTSPCNVFFEATAFSLGTSDPAHDFRFAWTFSDPGNYTALSPDHPQGRDRNRMTGAMASHTFTTPGIYTVQVEITNGVQTWSTTIDVDIADPDTTFGGTDTIAVSPRGRWEGMPVGAAQVATLSEALSLAATQGQRSTRILLQRGTTHDTADLPLWDGSVFDDLQIGAFGRGRRPLLSRPLVQSGQALSGDLVITDLALRGHFDPNVGNVDTAVDGIVLVGAKTTTLHNLKVQGFDRCIVPVTNASGLGISNCTVSDWATRGIELDGTDKCAVLGSRVAQNQMALPETQTGGPVHYCGNARRNILWQCDLFSNSGGTYHAPCVTWNADATLSANGILGASRLEGGNPVLRAAPETPGTLAQNGALDIEGCFLLGTANTGPAGLVSFGYGGTRMRNTVLVLPDVTPERGQDAPSFITGGAGMNSVANSAAPVTIQSNTFADLRSPETLIDPTRVFARRDTGATAHFTALTEYANLDYAPNLAVPVQVPGGMTSLPGLAPNYVGLRSDPDQLDQSYATPVESGDIPAAPITAADPVIETTDPASRDDFFGNLRRSSPIAGALGAGVPLSITVANDGDVAISGVQAGTADITVTGTLAQDVTTTVTIDEIAGPPIFISDPRASGDLTPGTQIEAVSGLFLYEDTLGVPVSNWVWTRGPIIVSTESTYTVDADDAVLGLALRQTVTNSRGSREATATIIASQSYAETPVQPNASTLASPGVLSSGSPTTALTFAKFVMPPSGDPGRLMMTPGTLYGSPTIRMWYDGERLGTNTLTEVQRFFLFERADYGLAAGDEISLLLVATDDGMSFCQIRNASGQWLGQETDVNRPATIQQTNIGSDNGNGPWSTPIYRIATWFGVAPDVRDPLVRETFVDPDTGELKHPTISHLLYGTPAYDFYGDAAAWNAGTHQGSLSSFTHSGGLFTNVS